MKRKKRQSAILIALASVLFLFAVHFFPHCLGQENDSVGALSLSFASAETGPEQGRLYCLEKLKGEAYVRSFSFLAGSNAAQQNCSIFTGSFLAAPSPTPQFAALINFAYRLTTWGSVPLHKLLSIYLI